MVIHTFGAYFGLCMSWAWTFSDTKHQQKDRSNNLSNKQSDTMAMIGTLFLFCFWPSFNGALAGTNSQDRAILNTYLSICSSCFVSFLVCSLTDEKNKFRMVEIQNSTIAGGVAVGTVADMLTAPCGAMLGGVCGGVSVLGYYYVTPVLHSKLGVEDTCGIHNLHGMPGIIGAIVGMIVSALEQDGKYENGTLGEVFAGRFDEEGHLVRSASEQAAFQCAGRFSVRSALCYPGHGVARWYRHGCRHAHPPRPGRFLPRRTGIRSARHASEVCPCCRTGCGRSVATSCTVFVAV